MDNGLFDSDFNLISFFAGIILAWLWQRIKCAVKSHKTGQKVRPPKWNPVVLAVAVTIVGFLYISAENTDNANAVRQLALETQRCQQEFNQALNVRSKITADNDHWSRVQREALATWIHDLIFPPPPYSNMEANSPQRQAWNLVRTQEADKIIRKAQEEQRQNDIERQKPENQYPEPTCGSTVRHEK